MTTNDVRLPESMRWLLRSGGMRLVGTDLTIHYGSCDSRIPYARLRVQTPQENAGPRTHLTRDALYTLRTNGYTYDRAARCWHV